MESHGAKPSQIYGHGGGLGNVMCDALREAGRRIHRVNNGPPANEPDFYANRSAEIWFSGRPLIERQEIILPDDKDSSHNSPLGAAGRTLEASWPLSRTKTCARAD
jgi:hypothetical protein